METYLTIEELADYLKIAEKTIRSWVLHRSIPFHKIMKSIRFRLSEIEKWINDGCYSALTEGAEDGEKDLLDEAISFDELAREEAASDDDGNGGEE